MTDDDLLEQFWGDILSRDARQILNAFQPLDAASRRQVLAHLRRMAEEEGWHPEQRRSAQAALDALKPYRNGEAG